jgi:hypothetical protein
MARVGELTSRTTSAPGLMLAGPISASLRVPPVGRRPASRISAPRGITPLYSGAMTPAGYPAGYYAVYFEDPDRLKVEVHYE